jgi:hypothetical protein
VEARVISPLAARCRSFAKAKVLLHGDLFGAHNLPQQVRKIIPRLATRPIWFAYAADHPRNESFPM